MIVLLVAAVATLVAGPGSGAHEVASVGRMVEHPTRALDALRTVSFSALHHAARIERTPSGTTASTGPTTLATLAIAVLVWSGSVISPARRGQRRWWGGRCWRAPPVTTTA